MIRWSCPSRGCGVRDGAAKAAGLRLRRGQNPHSLFPGEEKENAPFDGVREKGSVGGIPSFVRNDRTALYGGYWLLIRGLVTTQPRMAVSSVGGAPGCLLLLFCCRTLVVSGAWWKGCSRIAPASFLLTQFGGYRKNGAGLSQTARVRQRKEKGGASGRDPDYRFGQEKVQEAKLPTTAGPKPP